MMIELELRAVPAGGDGHERIAGVIVGDDGSVVVDDPKGALPTSVPVLVPTDVPGRPRQVFFSEAPAVWVRRLRTVLRGGYLVPVVVRDDGVPRSDGPAAGSVGSANDISDGTG